LSLASIVYEERKSFKRGKPDMNTENKRERI